MPWPIPADEEARLRLATTYPFAPAAGAFLLRDGDAHPVDAADFAGRTAVIAHGSNRAPEQLARKFAGWTGRDGEIPVTHVWLHDHDVVYAAHFSHYGSVTSALHHVPGCRVCVAVTWLDSAQLERMHETEGGYSLRRLEGAGTTPESGPEPGGAPLYLYHHDHGLLALNGQPVGLSAVAAQNRPYTALDQHDVQELVRDRLSPGRDLNTFILENIADPDLRARREAHLQGDALPVHLPGAVVAE